MLLVGAVSTNHQATAPCSAIGRRQHHLRMAACLLASILSRPAILLVAAIPMGDASAWTPLQGSTFEVTSLCTTLHSFRLALSGCYTHKLLHDSFPGMLRKVHVGRLVCVYKQQQCHCNQSPWKASTPHKLLCLTRTPMFQQCSPNQLLGNAMFTQWL